MIGKQKIDLQDVLDNLTECIKAEIFKIRIGEVKAFNPDTQKATIELVIKPYKEYENKEIKELPPITLNEVPLGLMSGSFGSITTPIQIGDYVSVFFTDTDNTDWFLTGEVRRSASKKKHDKNSSFFIPASPLPNNKKLNNYNNNAIILKKTDTGEVKIGDNVILIKNNAGGKVEVDSKVQIANDNKNLKTIFTTFANSLKQATVLNPLNGNFELPLDPGTKSAIDTFISDISSLLK